MKALFTVAAACVLVVAAGCDRPKAKQGLHVVSSTPADGATHVNVHDSIAITFSGPIVPDSVNANTVKLGVDLGVDNPLAMFFGLGTSQDHHTTYDPNTYTLTLKPRTPLWYGTKNQVKLFGIEDPFGDSLLRTKIAFKTWVNPATRYAYRSGTSWYCSTYENDAAGNQIRAVSSGPGTDSSCPGAAVTSCTENTYDAGGRQTRSVWSRPGTDGSCFGADDVVTACTENTYDADGRQTRSVSSTPGTDGRCFGADDVVSGYTTYAYDAVGNPTRYVTYNGPGTNAIWFDDDDDISSYFDHQYDEFGNAELMGSFNGPGKDGIWFTGDDWAGLAIWTRNDVFGNPTDVYLCWSFISQSTPGPDGIYLTSDDVWCVSSIKAEYGADGATRICGRNGASVGGAGADKTFFTPDDTFSSCDVYEYDASGNQTKNASYSTGTDQTWGGTGDDTPTGYHLYAYDSRGNMTLDTTYSAAGSETSHITYTYQPGTDNLSSSVNVSGATQNERYDYGYDGNGNRTSSQYWSGTTVSSCTKTTYDTNSNRKTEQYFSPPAGGTCSTVGQTNYVYEYDPSK